MLRSHQDAQVLHVRLPVVGIVFVRILQQLQGFVVLVLLD